MGQINTNNYPTVNSLLDADLLIVENATNGTGTTTPKQLRENAIGTDTLQTSSQTVTGAINELKGEIDAGAGVVGYDVDTITSGFLGGQFSGSANLLLLHLTTDGTADATNGYMMMLSYSRPVARFAYGRLVDADGVAYKQDVYADNTIICKISNSGTGTESDPKQVVILGIINAGFMLTPTAVVSDRDIIDGQGNTLSVLAEALTKTASGNPVVIDDCAGGKARSLITSINAIQDLHGLPFPYVGGAYKNKFNLANIDTDYFSVNNQAITNTQTDTVNKFELYVQTMNNGSIVDRVGDMIIESTGRKSLSFTLSGTFTHLRFKHNGYSRDLIIALMPWTATGDFTISFDVVGYNPSTAGGLVLSNIQLESGTTATSFAPYSNICPISGRDSVAVDDEGRNLLPYDAWKTVGIIGGSATWENNGVTLTATANDCYTRFLEHDFPQGARIPITNGQKITISWQETTNKHGLVAIFPNASMTGLVTADNATAKKVTYTGKSGDTFITFRFGVTNSGDVIAYKNIMIEYGDTVHDYEPYAHTTATIQLGTTVYGADINWDTGEMTVTDVIVDMGSLLWDRQSQYNRFISEGIATTVKKPTSGAADAISSCYRAVEAPDVQNNDGTFGVSGSSGNLFVRDDRYNNATAFATAIAGQTICYKLATTTTIQLTPAQLEMLKGYNRVSIEDGSIEIGYIAKLT